jgi:hypothetical protein
LYVKGVDFYDLQVVTYTRGDIRLGPPLTIRGTAPIYEGLIVKEKKTVLIRQYKEKSSKKRVRILPVFSPFQVLLTLSKFLKDLGFYASNW